MLHTAWWFAIANNWPVCIDSRLEFSLKQSGGRLLDFIKTNRDANMFLLIYAWERSTYRWICSESDLAIAESISIAIFLSLIMLDVWFGQVKLGTKVCEVLGSKVCCIVWLLSQLSWIVASPIHKNQGSAYRSYRSCFRYRSSRFLYPAIFPSLWERTSTMHS